MDPANANHQPAEGVVRFELSYTASPSVDDPCRPLLEGWRGVLRRLGMLGQDPERYEGFGFGNISHRLPPFDAEAGARPFLISGTQTGHLERLGARGWSEVLGWDLRRHRVEARGPVRPSSESVTHAAIYDASAAVRAVFHVHSPEIWRRARHLDLPTTPADAEYGTTAMAEAVTDLVARRAGDRGLIVMAGHEDGLLAYGPEAEVAGRELIAALARALG